MKPLGSSVISYYGNGHMRGPYSIHAIFHGKAVTTESKQLLSEGMFTDKQ
jgi:hypothetical protein